MTKIQLTIKNRARRQRFSAAAIICLCLAWLALPAAGQSVQAIYSFTGANGAFPVAGLTLGPDGNFYGTTELGGSSDRGTVFRFTIGGPLTTLASFAITNGSEPDGGLIVGPDGNFYGTTSSGGTGTDPGYFGSFGTVFRITTNGTVTPLVNFAITNGAYPEAGLAMDRNGNFYGTTEEGGADGIGTVFRVATNGALTILDSFNGGNGEYPLYSPLIMGPDGNFYGTTQGGGGYGNLFRITTNGTLTTLFYFGYTNGSIPQAGLTAGPDGNLYGTTSRGGIGGYGTVFQFRTNRTLRTLAYFNLTNGGFPNQLTLGPDGNFYGTTGTGGSGNGGSVFDNGGNVFKVDTNGILTILASFGSFTDPTGSGPLGSLTLGPDGNFYGTTLGGGSDNDGVIYRLNLPPSIITQPSNQIVLSGSDATFTLTLFGTAPFGYQWLSNNTPVAAATNSTLTIPDAVPIDAGDYQVIVTNAWGSVTSAVATLTVLAVPPMITNQPVNQSVRIGGTATFAVGATGTPPLAYQWYFTHIPSPPGGQSHARGGTQGPLPGATNATLSYGPVRPNQDGNYQVIVTNQYGSATSDLASLTVLLRPNFNAISNIGRGSMTLLVASTPGSTNRLWTTTNLSLPLTQWQPVSTNVADVTGLFQFTETNSSDAPARFYILSSP